MEPVVGSAAVQIGVVTLFPELCEAFLATSLVGRAIESGILSVLIEPLRPHGLGKHQSVDDTPYGGGSGMLMRVDCIVAALESLEARSGREPRPLRVLLTPQGAPFSQRIARELVEAGAFSLTCGRYEGFDERVRSFVDREISLGDFVLAGGEVAAMAVVEATARLVPGVLGNQASLGEESFADAEGRLLEYPQYTRPADFRGLAVPELLRSGDHAKIAEWRSEQALLRTLERRPDLSSLKRRPGSA